MSPWNDRELVFPHSGGEMAALMRDKCWEATPLGPVEHWPSALRAAVRMILTSRFSMWLAWGDPLTVFYNDAYRAGTLGTKRPWPLGAQASEVWCESWPEIGPRIAHVLADGRATWDPGLLLMLERNGHREETYHTSSYSPLHEDDGRVRGVLCIVTEDTERVISERRVGLLGKLASQTAGAKTTEELCAGIDRGLASDARDVPFALTYLFDAGGRTARLVSQTGFGPGAAGVASVLDLEAGSPWPLRQIAQDGGSVTVELPAASWPTGPWNAPPSHAFVVPIPRLGKARPAGAFIAGLNPHRVFDAAYREFVALLVGQIAAGLAGAEACEAERRRGASPAESDRPPDGDGRPRTSVFVEEALRRLPDAPDGSPAPAADAACQRLLVAEDNADMREYLRRLLGDRWQVDAVANGAQALAVIRNRCPDLVITDVMMPGLDGFGLLAEIRADPALRELPVIMLSGRAKEEARVEGLRAGATDYLGKPFASRELVARVETQLMRAALRSAERAHARYLQTILEQAPVAIAILRGPRHVFELANQPYRKIIGDREVVGRAVADALPEVVSQGFVDLLDRVYQTGEPFIGHSVPIKLQRTPNGPIEESFFDMHFQPLFDPSGAVTGIAGTGHEVTALATARRDAETANRAKDEFLAMLGHELRNPLAPIMTALELMRLRSGVGIERERAVIERQVHHLVGLIDDLLDVSRITRGKVDLRAEPLELGDVIARLIEVVSPLLEEHRHVLATDVASGLLVHGDPTRLAQIVSNLLTNAAKYTPAGGRIAVRAWRDADWVLVRVTDNGIGIEPAMLPRVFEPFAQSRQAIDRAQGGLGLGLAIVESLVKLHGGTVTARSDGRGRGSEFTVSLPLLASAPTVAAARPRRRVTASEARILIIDDNVDAAQLLADVLEAGGYHTLAAYDGPSALQAAAAFRPQVAVVDLGLPVMDGFELARLMLADPELAQAKLVALTGYGQAEDRIRTAAAGFEAHLVKPVDIEQLRSVIERLLSHPAA